MRIATVGELGTIGRATAAVLKEHSVLVPQSSGELFMKLGKIDQFVAEFPPAGGPVVDHLTRTQRRKLNMVWHLAIEFEKSHSIRFRKALLPSQMLSHSLGFFYGKSYIGAQHDVFLKELRGLIGLETPLDVSSESAPLLVRSYLEPIVCDTRLRGLLEHKCRYVFFRRGDGVPVLNLFLKEHSSHMGLAKNEAVIHANMNYELMGAGMMKLFGDTLRFNGDSSSFMTVEEGIFEPDASKLPDNVSIAARAGLAAVGSELEQSLGDLYAIKFVKGFGLQ